MEKCHFCGCPIDLTRGVSVPVRFNDQDGKAHEVCHLRHIANVRLDKIAELQATVQTLEDELWARDNPYEKHPWRTDVPPYKPAKGLVGRLFRWLLWEC